MNLQVIKDRQGRPTCDLKEMQIYCKDLHKKGGKVDIEYTWIL